MCIRDRAGIDLWSFSMLVKQFEQIHREKKESLVLISHQERIIRMADRIMVVLSLIHILETANFRLFKTVRMYIVYRDRLNSFENLFGNVAIFIPFGALLPWVDSRFAAWWKVLVNAFLFVAGIEVFQLFSSFGAFDVDDLLLNCFGAMLGYWGWLVFRKKA